MIVSKGLALCAGPQARSARSGSLSPCGARQRAIQIRKSWRPGSSRWWAVSWRRRVELVGNARCAQHVPLSARADFCTWITRVVFSWIYLSPTQRQPRARTTAPTSGSSVRTASAEAAPRLSSLSAASVDHSFMASCLQQRDASTVARRLLSARLPGGGPKAWVVVIKVGGPLLARPNTYR